MRLLCDGLSVPAIAVQMFISYSTAKTHVARLYQKLGAANRTQALMVAVQHGLIYCGSVASAAIAHPTVPLSATATRPDLPSPRRAEARG